MQHLARGRAAGRQRQRLQEAALKKTFEQDAAMRQQATRVQTRARADGRAVVLGWQLRRTVGVFAWLHVVRCTLHVVRCMLSAACCTLHVVRCTLHAVRCMLSVAAEL
jgi:hypothetical protein